MLTSLDKLLVSLLAICKIGSTASIIRVLIKIKMNQ